MRPLLTLSMLLLSSQALAQLNFTSFGHSGTGCPRNTVAFSPAPDGQSVSVLFDQFSVQVPQHDGENDNEDAGPHRTPRSRRDARVQHRVCSLAFNIELTDGQMVEAIEITADNRGTTELDAGLRASLHTYYVGHQGLGANPQDAKIGKLIELKQWGQPGRMPQPVSDNWVSRFVTAVPVRSGCAQNTNRSLRVQIKNHLEIQNTSPDATKAGLLVMDSSDLNASLRFRVLTRPCGSNTTPGRVIRRVVSR